MTSQATWVSARIIADAQQADALGDALMEAGALSVTVEDADAGTPEETPQYGEPGMATQLVWARSVLSALFDADQPVAEIVTACAADLGVDAVGVVHKAGPWAHLFLNSPQAGLSG